MSVKADRPHGPGEMAPEDSLPYESIGEDKIPQQGPKGDGTPQVPDLDFDGAGFQGGFEADESVPSATHEADMGTGKPGYAYCEDGELTGGTDYRYSSDRGRNS